MGTQLSHKPHGGRGPLSAVAARIDFWPMYLRVHLPTSLSMRLPLDEFDQWSIHKNDTIGQQLLASGYLTNLYIAVTDAEPNRTSIANRLLKAGQRSGMKWEFYVLTNAMVVLTCRPQDEAICVRAVEGK